MPNYTQRQEHHCHHHHDQVEVCIVMTFELENVVIEWFGYHADVFIIKRCERGARTQTVQNEKSGCQLHEIQHMSIHTKEHILILFCTCVMNSMVPDPRKVK